MAGAEASLQGAEGGNGQIAWTEVWGALKGLRGEKKKKKKKASVNLVIWDNQPQNAWAWKDCLGTDGEFWEVARSGVNSISGLGQHFQLK